MATVYDKSSLFLAPSGVSNGTVFVQKPVPIYGSEQVTNGDFSQEGAELVTNGDFATDSDWSKQAGWSISGGSANCNGTQTTSSFLISGSPLSLGSGKFFKITFDVSNYISGSLVYVTLVNTGGPELTNIIGNGSYTVYSFGPSNGDGKIQFLADSNFVGSIDNVSVKEVGQDWTLGTGWSIGEDKAVCDGSQSGNSNIYQSTSFVVGKTYKVSYELSDVTAGTAKIVFGDTGGTLRSVNGTYTEYYAFVSGTNFYIQANADFIGSVTNISVQEVLSPDGDFTFTRGSNLSATRVNEAQLIEKGRENVLSYSNNFSQWTKSGTTATGGQIGYNSSSDAWLITKAGGAFDQILRNVSANGVNTISFYAKAGTLTSVYFRGQTSSSIPDANFNLLDGSLTSSNNIISATSKDIGSGWYRLEMAFSSTITNVTIYPDFGQATAGNIYIQDAQLEQGLAATSVITTGASTVQAGILENTPRLDYSGGATCPSLLLEPSRTNRLANSENGYGWTTSNVTVLPFDGGINGKYFQLTSNASTSRFNVIENQWVNLAAATYTASVFAKKGTTDEIILTSRANYATLDKYASFNLTSGTIITTSTVTANIEEYSDGWYRCSITFTNPGSYSDFASFAYGFNYNASSTDTLFVTAPQSEIGSYATSYIPTYGTTQTRAADVCYKTGASDVIGSTTGSGYVEFTTYSHESFGGIFEIINTSDLEQRLLIWMTSTDDQIQLNIGSGIGGSSIAKNNVSIGKHKAVFTYTTSKIKFFLDGEKVGETTPSSLTGGFNKVDFYHPKGGVYIQKKEISQAVLFKTELSDLDARILTGATTYETFDEMALALNYTVYE